MIQEDVLYLLAHNLHRLAFESRKDVQVIFSYVLRFRPATASPKSDPIALSYIVNNRPEVLVELCKAYGHKETAISAGTVLREVVKSDAATAIILYHDPDAPSMKGLTGIQPDAKQTGKGVFWSFFNWIDQGSFEVGADAFTTFRVRLPQESAFNGLTFSRKSLLNTNKWLLNTWRQILTCFSISTTTSSSNRKAMSPNASLSNCLVRFF